jgi:parallel beta-helix repeat protein
MRRQAWFLILASIALVSAWSPLANAADAFIDCGQTLNAPQDVVLQNNLDCTGDGIIITSSDVTLDLGGHLLTGDGGGGDFGVDIQAGATNVIVSNGTINGFDHGVQMSGNSDTLADVALVDNNGDSVQISGANNTVRDSTLISGGSILFPSTAADLNLIENNTFVDDSVTSNGGDSNTIRGNTFYDGQINFAVGSDGSQDNVFDGNLLVASPANGITVSGDTSDNNRISNNIVQASGDANTEDGIFISDGDGTIIDGNTSTANFDNGIELAGSATGTVFLDNELRGNIDSGVRIAGTATGATLNGNVANNNAESGFLAAAGSAPSFVGNTTNFNGFLNGIKDDSDPGISASDGIGSNNTANGNDVAVATAQCSGTLCSVPVDPTDEPETLITCNIVLGASTVVDHPMDCGGVAALTFQGDDLTIDLSEVAIQGTPSLLIGPASGLSVTNGFLTNSASHGMTLNNVDDSSFSNIVITRASSNGIFLAPDGGADPTSTNTFSGIAAIGGAQSGLFFTKADHNVFSSSVLVGNATDGAGVFAAGTVDGPFNKITGSLISGNGGDGVEIGGVSRTVVTTNEIVGNFENGIRVAPLGTLSAHHNVVSKNFISSNRSDGLFVTADGTANAIGVNRTTVSGNVLSRNEGDGVRVESDPDIFTNPFSGNAMSSNQEFGMRVRPTSRGTVARKNNAFDNTDGGFRFEQKGSLISNKATHNGFVADSTAAPINDDVGLGIDAATTVSGCGNVAKLNDDPGQLTPLKLKKPC